MEVTRERRMLRKVKRNNKAQIQVVSRNYLRYLTFRHNSYLFNVCNNGGERVLNLVVSPEKKHLGF